MRDALAANRSENPGEENIGDKHSSPQSLLRESSRNVCLYVITVGSLAFSINNIDFNKNWLKCAKMHPNYFVDIYFLKNSLVMLSVPSAYVIGWV